MGWQDAPDFDDAPARGHNSTRGLLTPGNINLGNRPRVRNPDGSTSTVRSIGVNIDGREVLIPTVSDDGRIMSDEEAVQTFNRTGKHLGIFDTPENSAAYAQSLHEQQAAALEKPPLKAKPIPPGTKPKAKWESAPDEGGEGESIPSAPSGQDEAWWNSKSPLQTVYDKAKEAARAGGRTDVGSIRATAWYGRSYGPIPSVTEAAAALPAVGGTVGGLLGAAGGTAFGVGFGGVPGSVGGAAIGGAGGEAARQLLLRSLGGNPAATSTEAAKEIGKEAVVQGALDLAGQGVAKAVKQGGRGIVSATLKPSPALKREFPNLVDTAIKEKLPISKEGAEMAVERLGEGGRELHKVLSEAEAKGQTFDMAKYSQPIRDLVQQIEKEEAQNPGSKAQLQKLISNFLSKQGTGPITPTRMQEIKVAAQRIAEPLYDAADKGFPVSPTDRVLMRFNKALADGAKPALETIPGVAEINARQQSLIGAERAISAAANRSSEGLTKEALPLLSAFGGVMGGGDLKDKAEKGAVYYFLAKGLLTPKILSTASAAMTNEEMLKLVAQSPKLGAALLSIAEAKRKNGGGPAAPSPTSQAVEAASVGTGKPYGDVVQTLPWYEK